MAKITIYRPNTDFFVRLRTARNRIRYRQYLEPPWRVIQRLSWKNAIFIWLWNHCVAQSAELSFPVHFPTFSLPKPKVSVYCQFFLF